jgi:hypothetical protein
VAVHSKHEQSDFCPACLKDVRIPRSSTDVACIGSMNDEESEELLEDNLISSQDPGCEDYLDHADELGEILEEKMSNQKKHRRR